MNARLFAGMKWVPVLLDREAGPADRPSPARRPLFAVSRVHLEALSTGLGLWQHARGAKPDPRFGYCTDDVARSIVVDVMQSRELGWAAVDPSVRRSLLFLRAAFNRASGRFLNFRDADGRWLDAGASEDCHARAIAALAAVMVELPGTELADGARDLFCEALPAAMSFGAMRAISAALMACDSVCRAGLASEAQPAFDQLATHLVLTFGDPAAEWPWPEPILTYENAVVPHSLIAAGLRLDQPALLATGCSVLDWLIDVQVGDSGQFSPIGNKRWWRRGDERSRFDQQPIEAAALMSAAAAAFRATGRGRYLEAAEAAYGWFLGDNDLGVPLANPATGGCHDGLTPDGPNENQGAESTLMWLIALEEMRELRRSTGSDLKPVVVAEPQRDAAPRP